MSTISILCPTRNRPTELNRMVVSAFTTATRPAQVEILFYVDDDDGQSVQAISDALLMTRGGRLDYKVGPRIMLTQCWNELIPLARGDLFMQGNDDVIFKTNGWDEMVRATFNRVPDKILLVHGSDHGQHFENFAAHGIVHRRWIEAIGYFIPPYFSSDFGDTWINEVANALERRVYLPFVVEHMHHLFGKAQKDSTTLERLARHKKDNPDQIYVKTSGERVRDAEILRKLSRGPISKVEAAALGKLV